MLGTWAKTTLIDTDSCVADFSPVIRDPDMQAYLTDQVSVAIEQTIDAEQVVGDAVGALQWAVGERRAAVAALGLLEQPAIEGIRGVARVFLPDGPCYECTLGENDRRVLDARRSCALLTPEQMLEGKVPTNATTASIIGGIEAQEAIKLLHDRPGDEEPDFDRHQHHAQDLEGQVVDQDRNAHEQ